MRNLFGGVLFAAVAIVLLGITPARVIVAAATTSATPSPSATPTQPPASVVASVCISPGVDYTVNKWNFISPYLLCLVSDTYSGNAELLQRTSSGTYVQISHGGGDLPVIGLEAYGVPASVATQLRAGLHS